MTTRQLITIAAITMALSMPLHAQWQQTNGPWAGFDIFDLHVADTVVYAGTTNGVYRSLDRGLHWEGLAVDSLSGEVLNVTASGPHLYAATGYRIYRHVADEHRWVLHNINATNEFVTLHAGENDVLYGVTDRNGVFRSVDNGESWVQIDSASELQEVNTVCELNGTLYAGTYGSGVFRYDPASQSWTEWNNRLLNKYVRDLKVYRAPDGHESILAGTINGLYGRSETDNSWTNHTPDQQFRVIETIHCDNRHSHIYVTGDGGLYNSMDGGGLWTLLKKGFPQAHPHCIATIDSITLAGSDNDGVFRSTSFGATWQPSSSGIVNFYSLDLLSSGDKLYVACGQNGIFLSDDEGASWVSQFPRFPTHSVRFLEQSAGVVFGADFHGGLRRTSDDGVTWDLYGEAGFEHIETIDVSRHTLMVGTDGNLFLSRNGGASFYEPAAGLPKERVLSIAAHNTTVLVHLDNHSPNEPFLSRDDGLHWERITTPQMMRRARTPRGAFEDVFVVHVNGVVYKSVDSGQTWTEVPCVARGKEQYVESLLVYGSVMFAGTRAGIFRTTTMGEEWDDISENLLTTIYSLEVHKGYLYAGTRIKAVWRRPLDEVIVSAVEPSAPSAMQLNQNYPNPVAVGSSTTVSYELNAAGYVTLSVYNALGQKVAALAAGLQEQGKYVRTFNTAHLPTGVYLYRLIVDGEALTRRMIVSGKHSGR